MRYQLLIIIALFALVGCKDRRELELEIITKEINCLDIPKGTYKDYIFSDKIAPSEARTIVAYKLTNTTDDSYYFNLNDLNRSEEADYYIRIDKAHIAFYDANDNMVPTRQRISSEKLDNVLMEHLGYESYFYNDLNFIIHPDETLYFEWFLVLPFGTLLEEYNYSAIFDNSQSYSAQLFLSSEGINYKKDISRTDLKTIEENGYKVFNGVLKSKNKIPIVFKAPKHKMPNFGKK